MQKTTQLNIALPILPGSISTAKSTCGKPQCICHRNPRKRHGVYYRWTGLIRGKRTTKTLSQAQAQECLRRINNYRQMQRQIARLVAQAFLKAPWL